MSELFLMWLLLMIVLCFVTQQLISAFISFLLHVIACVFSSLVINEMTNDADIYSIEHSKYISYIGVVFGRKGESSI